MIGNNHDCVARRADELGLLLDLPPSVNFVAGPLSGVSRRHNAIVNTAEAISL